MKDEIQSMCLTPDIVKQFNTLFEYTLPVLRRGARHAQRTVF